MPGSHMTGGVSKGDCCLYWEGMVPELTHVVVAAHDVAQVEAAEGPVQHLTRQSQRVPRFIGGFEQDTRLLDQICDAGNCAGVRNARPVRAARGRRRRRGLQ